jgi:hypothetical protein
MPFTGVISLIEAWLCILNKQSWEIVSEFSLWAVTVRHARPIYALSLDDILYFYCKHPESAVVGIGKVVSQAFTTTTHDPWRVGDYPHRVKISTVGNHPGYNVPEPIPFKQLVGNLTSVSSKFSLRGHAMIKLTKADNEYLSRLIQGGKLSPVG